VGSLATVLILGALVVIVVRLRAGRTTTTPRVPLEETPQPEGRAAVPLPALDGGDEEEVTNLTLAVGGSEPFLRCVSGPSRSPNNFPLPDNGVFTIGRAPDNDLVIVETAASGRHCRLERLGNTYVLTDLGSRNKTWVNGIEKDQVVLRNGDQIRVGDSTLVFAMFGERDADAGVVVARTLP
jgi:pSer/pThr/pTyr-binding forkhead associated (FHA) protein